MPLSPSTPRECGSCSACCQAVAVKSLSKPTGICCIHQCGHGCAIYSTRPKECRDFRCLWLNGCFDDDDRPDRLGAVFYEEADSDGRPMVMVVESQRGAAAASPRIKMLLRLILHAKFSVVLRNAHAVAKLTPSGDLSHAVIDPNDALRVRPMRDE